MLDSRDVKLLHWKVQELLIQLVINCKKRGVIFKVISTVRDDEYQEKLFNQGRTTEGNIVTNAKRPSFHSNKVALAFDVVPFVNGKIDWDAHKEYQIIGEEGVKLGLTWGGNWKSISDKPHFQLDEGLTSSQILAGKRPSWFYDKKPIEQPKSPLQILHDHKIITNISSWGKWLSSPFIQGEIVKALIVNFYKKKTGKTDFIEAMDYIVKEKIISSKEYWLDNCAQKKFVKSEWVKLIIERMASKIQ